MDILCIIPVCAIYSYLYTDKVGWLYYKWKNHFSEMKGDVGMSHHEKEGNKKMPIPRQEIIDNPIPISLFMYYAAVLLCVDTGGVQFEDK